MYASQMKPEQFRGGFGAGYKLPTVGNRNPAAQGFKIGSSYGGQYGTKPPFRGGMGGVTPRPGGSNFEGHFGGIGQVGVGFGRPNFEGPGRGPGTIGGGTPPGNWSGLGMGPQPFGSWAGGQQQNQQGVGGGFLGNQSVVQQTPLMQYGQGPNAWQQTGGSNQQGFGSGVGFSRPPSQMPQWNQQNGMNGMPWAGGSINDWAAQNGMTYNGRPIGVLQKYGQGSGSLNQALGIQ